MRKRYFCYNLTNSRIIHCIMNIAALLSGGVDSSVAVHLLKEQGYTPDLFYIKIGSDESNEWDCSEEEDWAMATMVARKYGCKLERVDLHKEYWENVVGYTIERLRKGLTPNPDVMCNRLIKFGVFEKTIGHNYDYTATGHYASTEKDSDGNVWLTTSPDPVKDQTDFLAQLDNIQISHAMFPIGKLEKDDVRRIAHEAHIPSADRKDSQGICFLGKINYNELVRRYLGEREGLIVEKETGNIIGRHKGYWYHTIGQRKGLGVSGRPEPLFIIATDTVTNTVYVGQGQEHPGLYRRALRILPEEVHWVSPDRRLSEGESRRFSMRIRYRQPLQAGVLHMCADGAYMVFDVPQRGITPGQFAVWYDGDELVGSGVISE